MTDVSAVLHSFFTPGNTPSTIYQVQLLYLLSGPPAYTQLQTVVKHRRHLHSHYSMHYYAVFEEKKQLNSTSGYNVQ